MEKKTYSEKLKDPRWQKLRLEIFNRDEWRCQQCGGSETTLAVHHLRYISGRDPWEYLPHQLLTLCESCHSIECEMMQEEIGSLIEQVKDKGFLSASVGMIASGFNGLTLKHPPEVVASIIEAVFRDDDLFSKVTDLYFKSIRKVGGDNKNEG